jgi:hypothetical protein
MWILPSAEQLAIIPIVEIECPNCKKIILAELDGNDIRCSECKIVILQRHINSTSPGGLYAQN